MDPVFEGIVKDFISFDVTLQAGWEGGGYSEGSAGWENSETVCLNDILNGMKELKQEK